MSRMCHSSNVIHTTAGGVETGLLAHERRVLHCATCQYATPKTGFPLHRFHAGTQCSPVTRLRLPLHLVLLMCLLRVLLVGDGRRTLCAEELAGDVQGLAAHDNDLLTVEQLLGDGAGKATEQVPLAVDDLIHKSARCSNSVLWCAAKWALATSVAAAAIGEGVSCARKVRTMTGSNVDILSNPGDMLVVSGVVVESAGVNNAKSMCQSVRRRLFSA